MLDSTNEWFTNRNWCSFYFIFTANTSVVDIAEVRVAFPGLCLKAWSRCSGEAIVCGGGVSRTTSVTVGDLGDLHKTWICLSLFLKSLFYLVSDMSPVWWRWRDLTTSSYFWHVHACIDIYYKFLYSQNQNYIYLKKIKTTRGLQEKKTTSNLFLLNRRFSNHIFSTTQESY